MLEPTKAVELDITPAILGEVLIWLQYLFPWSLVIYAGLQLVRHNLLWSWCKLITVWAGVTLLFLLVTNTQHGYVFLCPALALAGGAKLEQIRNLPSFVSRSRLNTSWGLMAVAIAVVGLYCKLFLRLDLYLTLIFIALVITLTAVSVSIAKREAYIPLLFWGFYVSLFIFVSSPYWIWEPTTFKPLKQLANLIQQNVPHAQIVYTSSQQDSSALSFYSQHQIVALKLPQIRQYWTESTSPHLLLDDRMVRQLDLSSQQVADFPQIDNWFLAVKNPQTQLVTSKIKKVE